MIVRYLDGELDADGRAEVSRIVLRDPAARAMMETYRVNDEKAAQAFSTLFGGQITHAIDTETLTQEVERGRWIIGARALAAAAAILLVLGISLYSWSLSIGSGPGDETLSPVVAGPVEVDELNRDIVTTSTASAETDELALSREYMEAVLREAAASESSVPAAETMQRGLIRVVDPESNQIYWLQIDRTATVADVEGMDL